MEGNPVLLDFLQKRLHNEKGVEEIDLFMDFLNKEQYEDWKKTTGISL